MVLIGCDFHPSWQQVSWLDRETGEAGDHKLVHEAAEGGGVEAGAKVIKARLAVAFFAGEGMR